jgi:hypothetical protein
MKLCAHDSRGNERRGDRNPTIGTEWRTQRNSTDWTSSKEISSRNYVAFKTHNLCNRGNKTCTTYIARDLHNEVDCGTDLFANCPERKIHPTKKNHRLKSAQCIPW